MLKYLEKLSTLNGVSGCEEEVRTYIEKEITPFVDSIKKDNLGNLIVFKRGVEPAKHKLMLSAHMDEVGLIVTGVTAEGYLRVASVGGIDDAVLFGRTYTVGKNRIPGVIGGVPLHLLSAEKRKKVVPVEDLYLDIGASSKQEALKMIKLGERVAFDTEFDRFGDNLVKGKALDDRAGCAVLMDILKEEIPYDMHFVFAVQEEVGLRGARCAAYTVNPEFAIVAEATTAADIAGVPDDKQVCRVSGGAVISFMDRSTVYDREMYDRTFAIGQRENIPLQTKTMIAGGNDAGAIHVSRGGVRTLAVSLPCRYLHSPCSVLSVKDMKSARDIIAALSRDICAGELS